jgi:hypothetical protein
MVDRACKMLGPNDHAYCAAARGALDAHRTDTLLCTVAPNDDLR